MKRKYFRRQMMAILVVILAAVGIWAADLSSEKLAPISPETNQQLFGESTAMAELEKLEIKGRAPKTDYSRKQFGDGWGRISGCSVREVILARDLTDEKTGEDCKIQSGILQDPYTGSQINFVRGPTTSAKVQIDHVVALSDAWQKGAQQLTFEKRQELANDPLNLLAVDGPANQAKGDGDAATWLPPNKNFRCQYVSRQVAVKRKYDLWITEAEKAAISGILASCQ